VKSLILSEVNVKEIEFINDDAGILVKKIKPNFKLMGPKYGKLMKQIAAAVTEFSQSDINTIEQDGVYSLEIGGETVIISLQDVEILSEDIPGWLVANTGNLSVALDITITEKLREEGIARELINRIQNIRKDSDFEVTDKINLKIEKHDKINSSISNNISYICTETLAVNLDLVDKIDSADSVSVELADEINTMMLISKV
jgi:isoleucyl-tRNA synthetase